MSVRHFLEASTNKTKRILAVGIAALLLIASMLSMTVPAYAATFSNDYPDMDAYDCSDTYGPSSWCKGTGTNKHWISPRTYGYRNCTDGVAYWVSKYTGKSVQGWSHAKYWDERAGEANYAIKANTANNIEPGDIAQRNTGTYGHVGFVTEVTKNESGAIISIMVAELNHDWNGNFRHSSQSRSSWDNFIDVNGVGFGLNNESLSNDEVVVGPPNLYFVKTRNTTSGLVEVNYVTASSGYQSHTKHLTDYSTANADNGTFQMVGKDLYFIKTRNTASGKVEVNHVDFATNYQVNSKVVTDYSVANADSGWFQMVGSDLYFVKTKNTVSGLVEVNYVTASSGYQSHTKHLTDYSVANADNGWFQMVGKNLYFIKTRNTASGRVEVNHLDFATNYQVHSKVVTDYSVANADNGWFQMVGSDLYFVKTRNTTSGLVEINHVNATANYQANTKQLSDYSVANADSGWFQMAQN